MTHSSTAAARDSGSECSTRRGSPASYSTSNSEISHRARCKWPTSDSLEAASRAVLCATESLPHHCRNLARLGSLRGTGPTRAGHGREQDMAAYRPRRIASRELRAAALHCACAAVSLHSLTHRSCTALSRHSPHDPPAPCCAGIALSAVNKCTPVSLQQSEYMLTVMSI
jgi:hypothetical protein